MASLIGFLPYAFFGPAIGVLVDRYDRKMIMICADLIIALAGGILALIAMYMELPVWIVIGSLVHIPKVNIEQESSKRNFIEEMRQGLFVLKENKWIHLFCFVLWNYRTFSSILQRRSNIPFSGEN